MRRFADIGDHDRVLQAAGFGDLDIDHGRSLFLDHADRIFGGEDRLVGHNGNAGPFGDIFHAVQVMAAHRLFAEFDIKFFHLIQAFNGRYTVPALVGVNTDLYVRTDGFSNGFQTQYIFFRI